MSDHFAAENGEAGRAARRIPVDEAITSGHLRVDGERAEARRFVEMFLFPSTEDATV